MPPKKTRRPRGSGSLTLGPKGWIAQYPTPDGRRTKVLGTFDKPTAKRALAKLVKTAAPPAAPLDLRETFEDAAIRVTDQQRAAGLETTAKDRLARLTKYAFPTLAAVPVTDVSRPALIAVLQGAARAGRSQQTIEHLRKDLSVVFRDLLANRQIDHNPAIELRGSLPKAPRDKRPRMILTDEHFAVFVTDPRTPLDLRVLALASRCLGGMRAGDLHRWAWDAIDWTDSTTRIIRPKTDDDTRHEIPADLLGPLKEWHLSLGRPTEGPVFPTFGRGRRKGVKGTHKKKSSYAKRLRKWLWALDLHVPLPGWDNTRERDAYQTDTAKTRKADFHSFRRAYCTGLAVAGVNVQTAMQLAGHRSPITHMRYVQAAEKLITPSAALPKLGKKEA